MRLFAVGCAAFVESAGAGRFAALAAAQRGLANAWQADATSCKRAFVGFAFTPEGGAPFPNARLWVPELLLCEEHGRIALTLSCAAEQAGRAVPRWRKLWRELTTACAVPRAPIFRIQRNPVADQAFLARGQAALAAIRQGAVDKLVLTRTLRVTMDQPIMPTALIGELARQHPACAVFGLGNGRRSFLGASPETLLAIDKQTVMVDALAGTAWQDTVQTLEDEKNRREHDCVATAIIEALAGVCSEIDLPANPEVMQLSGLSHLRRRVRACRLTATNAFDLLARLHPTPAVGGTPTADALDWLAGHGDTRAAWYTGGFGWIDTSGDCDIAVALRCGLFEGCEATLYAGAGFVAGSDPKQELAETEAKLTALLNALATLGRPNRAVA